MVFVFYTFLIGGSYFFLNRKVAASISIIGGADGPTSIFLAGKVNNNDLFITVLIIAAAALGFFFLRRILKHRKENTQYKK